MSTVKVIIKEGQKGLHVTSFLDVAEYLKKHADNRSYLADVHFIQGEMRNLLGRVLTIIDAATVGTQNKAMKDLVKNTFTDEFCELTELFFSREDLQEMSTLSDEEAKLLKENPEVLLATTDEALGIK